MTTRAGDRADTTKIYPNKAINCAITTKYITQECYPNKLKRWGRRCHYHNAFSPSLYAYPVRMSCYVATSLWFEFYFV